MARLTPEQVLLEAGELVCDLYDDMAADDMTPQQNMDHIANSIDVMEKAIEIMNKQVYGNKETVQ